MFENDNSSDYLPAATSERSVTSDSMVGRQMQEVKAMVFMAKQFPRDLSQSFQRIMTACERKLVAENSQYEYPRGSEKVSGPSVRLMEVIAQNWGNIDTGVVELEQKNGESVAMAYAWDLETNVRETKIFTVKHERHTKRGIQKLSDPRDIYELVANMGSRRRRACILGVIPGDIVEKAIEQCNKTLKGTTNEPLIDRLNKVMSQFEKEFSVSTAMIETHFGYKVSAFTENDLIKLKKIGLSIRDGMSKREDYFELGQASAATKSSSQSTVLDGFEEFLKQSEGKGGVENVGSDQGELPL